MGGPGAQPGGILQYLIPIVVIGVVFAFRAKRMSRVRPLKLGQLWIIPALYLFIVAATFFANPPGITGWLATAIGLAIGCVLGWYRGKTTRIAVDPVTRTLNQRASPFGVLVLLGFVVVRSVARVGGQAAHLDVLSLTDGLLGLALGTFAVMRIEMYLRAKRILRSDLGETFS